MGDTSLINVGKLAKPATVLIEKISGAIGIYYEPTRIKKKAIANAEASKTKVLMDLEIEDIQKRALSRLVTEEIKKQENIENITEKSFDSLNENAKPENIEDDWIGNFFDKCKLISDIEMQNLWAKILAGEANNPGAYSKRTIEFISTMDKTDAMMFDDFSKTCWFYSGFQPIITNYDENEVYKKLSINFNSLTHLNDIGLINFEPLSGFKKIMQVDTISIGYYGRVLNLDFTNKSPKEIQIGQVLLTKIGSDLLKASHPNILYKFSSSHEYIDKYYHEILNYFNKQGVILSEPLENKENFQKFVLEKN